MYRLTFPFSLSSLASLVPAFTLRNDWLQPLRAEWLIELGSTEAMPTSKAILAPVCGLPHTCQSVYRSELLFLPANVIAPHIARASGKAHLQSEEIVERLYDTAMPTNSATIGPTGSAAEEVSACHDALAYSVQWLHPAQLLVPLGRSSVGISSLKSVLVVGIRVLV